MVGAISVQFVFNHIPAIAAQAEAVAGEEVMVSAANIEAGARMRSRVDTGDMRDRWHHLRTGPTSAEVVNDSDHVLPNEYGTIHMSAQPMAHPAADAEAPQLSQRLAQRLGRLA